MCLKTIPYIILCFFLTGLQAEEKSIYKKTNEQGVVEFSDVPSGKSKQINVPKMNTFKQKPLPKIKANKTSTSDEQTASKLTIKSPLDDASVRANDGNITISILLDTDLSLTQEIQVTIDNDPNLTITGKSTDKQFKNISRGTHQVQAFIVNKSGEILSESNRVTFHLLRFATQPAAPKNTAKP